MKIRIYLTTHAGRFALRLLLLSTLNPQLSTALAQSTAFTYQGRLNDNGAPANNVYDLRFTIYDSTNLPGTTIAGPLTNSAIGVSNGLFSVTLDFGAGVFTGPPRWLDIAVRPTGNGAFSPLNPRQPLTPTPQAIFANTASNLSGVLPASQLSGTIPSGNLSGTYAGPMNFNNGADSFNGTFYGQFFGSSFVGGNFVGSFIGSGNGLGDVWHTGGNLNTSPTNNNFLGTTDNQPLEVRVGNTRVLRLEPDGRGSGAGSLIGGHPENQVQQPGSGGNVIAGGGFGGGGGNIVFSNSAGVFIGAGSGNQAGPNVFDVVIAGGIGNSVQSSDSVIGGGANQVVKTNAGFSFIGGGQNNVAGNGWSVIAGGYVNNNYGFVSFIGSGDYNFIGAFGSYSVVGGGYANTNHGSLSFLGGGDHNLASSPNSFLGAGSGNTIQTNAEYSFIGGGLLNTIQTNADQSVIVGGNQNSIQFNAYESFVGGGFRNVVLSNAYLSFIGGGADNTIDVDSYASTIGGGIGSTISSNAYFSTIVGGGADVIGTNSVSATIGGGYFNGIGVNSRDSVVAGGNGNFIQDNARGAFIAGGVANTILNGAGFSSLGGGNFNLISNNAALAVIGGGWYNTNSGFNATIPGGYQNVASGQFSFAAGTHAKATNDGAFVWADSQGLDFNSTTVNQFSVRANGGVRFVTAGAGMTLDGQPILGSSSFAPASGSASYIQNQTAAPQAAGFNINGTATASALIASSAGISGTVGANALIVTNSVRVPGAGIGTSTPAFVHRATGANIEPGALHRTTITHPLCDGDPNAILIITHNFNPSLTGSVLDTNQASVFYNTILSKWQIYHDNLVALTTNCAWNVLVIKP